MIFLKLADLTVPPEKRTVDLGLFLAQALPDDKGVTLVEYGTDRREALERLVVAIDAATANLYEARRLALEIIQEEAGLCHAGHEDGHHSGQAGCDQRGN